MQPQLVGPRTGTGPACLGCRQRTPYSPIRNLIKLLYPRTFYFHFKNLHYANYRNDTFLCYEINEVDCGELVPLCQGIFRKEPLRTSLPGMDDRHAELCFLSWFHTRVLEVLSPSKEYKITWYVSWSPCCKCAEHVARFLTTHRNLSLVIFSSRLYYFNDPYYQCRLQRLFEAGGQLFAMDYPEFKMVWNKFVDNGGRSFRPWKKLTMNFRFQASTLKLILRSYYRNKGGFGSGSVTDDEVLGQMVSLNGLKKYFSEFTSARIKELSLKTWVKVTQRITYLCYKLEPYGDQNHLKGCLQNKKGKHAEILFIDEMRSLELSQERITCYLTWSPCPDCAQKLAAFKTDHPDLDLRVYVSRLYFHWWRKYQEGLCSLWRSGIRVAVMDLPQFTDCWRNFVSPQKPFRPWKKLEKNSRCLQRRLRRIQESWGLQDLINDFGNLQLGPSS
ncbi:DNA dC [Sigmodon hispidus]